MQIVIRRWILPIISVSCLLSLAVTGYAELTTGQTAPMFALKDINGKAFDLAKMRDKPLIIVYFFDVNSRPSQEGLFSLNQLAKQHKTDMTVLAVTAGPQDKVARFASGAGLIFPVFSNGGTAMNLYQAKQVLPAVCIIGPGLKVLDYFQGGGKSTEAMLVRLAERELQRKRTGFARAVGSEVVKKNPGSSRAKAVMGYAALKEADLKKAENIFSGLSKQGREGEILGKEGLAAVYKKRNQHNKALRVISEVEQKAPERAYVHVLKGDILYSQNKKAEAEKEYHTAVDKKVVEPYQDAVRYNQLGRFYATTKRSKEARVLYEKAVTIDPYYVEGTTNKGLSFEKEGNWDEALKAYQQALAVNRNDVYATVLARRAREMLDLQKDTERKKRIDQLVKDLAGRFRSQKPEKPGEDTWTSRPMVLTFVDFEEKGGLSEREGFSTVVTSELTADLSSSGRVKVVERVLMDRLLEELNLGTSDLANPETALKLGKILAAKLVGTGSLISLPDETIITLRLIDTESSEIPQLTTREIKAQASLEKELLSLNREILKTVITKYPLRGFVMKIKGDEVLINLGSQQGVVSGTRFDVLEEQETLEYKGKVLKSSPKVVGTIEVVAVEADFARARLISQQRTVRADDKIQERLNDFSAKL